MKLYSHMVWRLLLDILSRGLVFLVNILVARELGPGLFGKFSYVISFAQIFYIFTDLGTHLQLMKEMGEAKKGEAAEWPVYFELKLILTVLCLLMGWAISPWVWHWEHSWLVPLGLIWMLSNSFLDFSQFLCNGLHDLVAARKFMVTQRVFTIGGVLLPIALFHSLEGVMIGLAAGSAVGTTLAFRNFLRTHPAEFKWRGHLSDWRSIIRRSFPIGISGVVGVWYLRIGVIILGWVGTTDLVGEYSAAFRLYEISYVVPSAIMAIGLPHLSGVFKHDPAAMNRELFRLTKIMFLIGASWALFLYFGSEPLIRLLYGGAYVSAAPVLRIFSISSLLVFGNFLITHLMLVFNHQRRHAFHLIFVLIVCVLLNVLWIPTRGSEGPALVLLVGECLTFLLTLTFLLRRNRRNIWPDGFGTIAPL